MRPSDVSVCLMSTKIILFSKQLSLVLYLVGLGPGPRCTARGTVLADGEARVLVLRLIPYVLQKLLIKQRKPVNIHGVRAERARRTAREGRTQEPTGITLTR